MELEPKEAHSSFHCSAKFNITTYFSSGLGKQYSDSGATGLCTWDECKNQNGFYVESVESRCWQQKRKKNTGHKWWRRLELLGFP